MRHRASSCQRSSLEEFGGLRTQRAQPRSSVSAPTPQRGCHFVYAQRLPSFGDQVTMAQSILSSGPSVLVPTSEATAAVLLGASFSLIVSRDFVPLC